MSTFGLGQVQPPQQMLLPSQDVSAMRRELRELEAVVEDWKKRNPQPDLYDTKWQRRLDSVHGDKVRRINYLRNEMRAIAPLVQVSSEGARRNMSPKGRFTEAKNEFEQGDGEGPLEQVLVRRYNEAYYNYLYAGERDFDDQREFVADIKKDRFGYAGTLLNPKADPLGRFLLCDIRIRSDFEQSILCLAGDPKGLPLGETHPDPSEGCLSQYLRMHSGRPGGVRAMGMGLGTTLYLGTMLAAAEFGGFAGIYSMDGGCGSIRTDDADKLWRGLVEYGLAEEGESDWEENQPPDPDEYGDDYEQDGYNDDYPGMGGDPVQYMSARKLQKHPAIAFTCSGNNGALPPQHKSNWMEPATGDRPAGTPRYGGTSARRRVQLADDILATHWKDANTPKITDKRTAEMLAASIHGASPMLVVFVAEAIKNSRHSKAEDLTVAYLTRPDISSMVRGNQRVLELLGQQRLPGLGGLSGAAMREVMGVMRVGRGLGQGDNPMHLPPKSAELKRLVSQYPEF